MSEKTTKANDSKREAVKQIMGFFEGAHDVLFTDFRGLNVAQITQLRNTLRQKETDYRIVKNNYTKIAIRELGLPDASELLFGPTAVALVRKDVGPVAKAILDFSKESSVLIKGGIVGGKVFSLEQVEALSNLPGRDQLIATLMSAMNAPLQNLTYCLGGIVQKLVLTLKAVADKKGREES
jgi:large subunit ribosomal protein L10